MGDFHFDLLDIDTDYQKKFDRMREMVADDLLLRGWSQIVDEPTRSVKGRNKALLHHIYVNNIDYHILHVLIDISHGFGLFFCNPA